MFNVSTGTLEETIPIPAGAIPQGANGVHINYVELGARHAFVCTPFGVLILPRNQRGRQQNGNIAQNGDAEAPLYLDFPSFDQGLRIPQLVRHYAARMIQSIGPASNPAMREFIVTAPRVPDSSTALVRLGEDRQEFTAGSSFYYNIVRLIILIALSAVCLYSTRLSRRERLCSHNNLRHCIFRPRFRACLSRRSDFFRNCVANTHGNCSTQSRLRQ